MTIDEAHKRLDEEYKNNKTITIGIKRGKVPNAVRVAMALHNVTKIAEMESPFFNMVYEGE